ncbi:indole-3-glycerol phosphate synthase TrpC [Oscillospiraceae bacterium CM]|nr:indole-3-glycerol phosphate synthase TrpC [Oscillospiraceae bacterium CM]
MILDKIAASTRQRVAMQKKQMSLEEMKARAAALPIGGFPFEDALKKTDLAFICELKHASPSKGLIVEDFPYLELAEAYEQAGADAVSVLTEPAFFLGSNRYLTEVSMDIKLPILRKDFILDDYQLYESKLIRANAVLLICALLDGETIKRFIGICDSLGLSALVEAHDETEVKTAYNAGARIIGVNNRDLKTFEVDIQNSIRLRPLVPDGVLFVAESGIQTADDIAALHKAGVNAVLIGETLMKSADKKVMLEQLRQGCLA